MNDTPEKAMVSHVEIYKQTFQDGVGEEVLLDLLERFYLMGPLVRTKKIDPLDLAYNEGQRNVVLYILKQLNTDLRTLKKLIEQRYKDKNHGVIDGWNE